MPLSSALRNPANSRRGRRAALRLVNYISLAVSALWTPAQAQPVEAIQQADGVEVWHVPEPSIPLVSIRFALAGGALRDPVGKEGLTALTTALLTEGAGDRDAQDFARELAKLGAKLSFSAGRDQLIGNLDALSSHLTPSIELLRQALQAPRFDADAFARVRDQQIADLELAAVEPRKLAFDRWYAETYPGQLYGRPVNGVSNTVRSMTVDDARAHHRRLLASTGLRLVIVGDATREAARTSIALIAAALSIHPADEPKPSAKPQLLASPISISTNQPQATAAFGIPVIGPGDPDYPALQVLNQIIGSGDFDSILMEEIRVKRGLAYAVSTNLSADSVASVLVGGMATSNESMSEAISTLQTVLARTSEEGPSAAQFEAAKGYLIGSRALDLDGTARRASTLLRLWLQGYGTNQLTADGREFEHVAIADVRRVAQKTLDWNRFNLVIVGPEPSPR